MSSGTRPPDTDAGGGARGVCTPCGGTGRLISGLGGAPFPVRCPWCAGAGSFVPTRNAQEAGPAEKL